ncbi:hypothetical protein IEQ34_006695 [Dendrobium chrysotoxum]|uniref:Uncharacterized protein n=1 Tax=Dendrobium chrysotoxum TaxID=161865 RepID=A0AAV7H8D2_DENCH|nr:hypothetical protein IEQ34_006695 [Dendrobium chrysotoxum]
MKEAAAAALRFDLDDAGELAVLFLVTEADAAGGGRGASGEAFSLSISSTSLETCRAASNKRSRYPSRPSASPLMYSSALQEVFVISEISLTDPSMIGVASGEHSPSELVSASKKESAAG